jgi:hypothetical protein
MKKNEFGSLRSQLIGMMECWNIGMSGLENQGIGEIAGLHDCMTA